MANLTNSSNIIDEINSKLTNPEGGSNGQVLTMVGGGGWDTQGPCPDGFHIPTKEEFELIINTLYLLGPTDGSDVQEILRLPVAGFIYQYGFSEGYSRYWTVNPESSSTDNNAIFFSAEDYNIDYESSDYRYCGMSIRPFKDEPVAPGDDWNNIRGNSDMGVFENSSLGLITIIGPDGMVTISDKNLGASEVYNYGYEITESNRGKFYQWGNNYGFPQSGYTTSTTLVDASSYGPGNYYSSNTFIISSYKNKFDWSFVKNDNLRGGVTQGKGGSKLVPEWKDIEALPEGGTAGQVLTKTATGAEWSDPSGGNNTVYATQEEYDALTPEENVDYVIYGDGTEDDEYATKKYVDENALPKGGTDGQVLTRVGTTGATWKDSTGGIGQETVGTTMKVDYLWLGTETELSSLGEYKEGVVYLTIE